MVDLALGFDEAAEPVKVYGSFAVTKVVPGGGGCGSKAVCISEETFEPHDLVAWEVAAVPGCGERPAEWPPDYLCYAEI